MRALGRALEAASAGATDDATIRTRILDGMAKTQWCQGPRIDVRVENGGVELDGTIFDDRERTALVALASNVPGVRHCIDHITWIEPNTGVVFTPEPKTGLTFTPEEDEKVPPAI